MIVRRQQPVRPFSRLDNFIFNEQSMGKPVQAIGIPEKLMSASKPFPQLQQEEEDRENIIVMAPRKQQKTNKHKQNNENDQVFRRRILSDVTDAKKNISTKISQVKASAQPKVDQTNIVTIAEHLAIKEPKINPFSQQLRNTEIKKQGNKVCIVGEQKSFARRVKQRIEAQNAKKGQRKRKNSIGEEAYLPIPLNQLRKKIGEKSRKCSEDYSKIIQNTQF